MTHSIRFRVAASSVLIGAALFSSVGTASAVKNGQLSGHSTGATGAFSNERCASIAESVNYYGNKGDQATVANDNHNAQINYNRSLRTEQYGEANGCVFS